MKTFHRYVIAAVLLLSVMATIFSSRSTRAADQGTKTVTVHKLIRNLSMEDELDRDNLSQFKSPEGYDGSQTIDQFNALLQAAGRKSVTEIGDVYFALQNGEGQWLDQTGRVVASVDEAYGMLTSPTGAVFDTSQLPAGKYKLVEIYEKSTFKGGDQDSYLLTHSKAAPVELTLPMIKADGTTIENAHTYPKNTLGGPSLSKNRYLPKKTLPSGKAEEEYVVLGTPVEYAVGVGLPGYSHYKHLSFVDTMTEGLTLTANPYGQKVYVATPLKEGVPQFEQGADKDYVVEYPSERSYVLTFTQKGLDKLNAWTAESYDKTSEDKNAAVFSIRYTAYVNANAHLREEQVNTVTMTYGNNPSVLLKKEASTTVPIGAARFVKMDGRTEQRLPLAQFTAKTRAKDPTDGLEKDFYLAWKPVTGYGVRAEEEAKIATLTEKQTLFHAALDAYNALSKTQKEDPVEKKKVLDAKKAFDAAFAAAHVTYVWDTEKTNPNVLRLTSNEKGQFFLLDYYKTVTHWEYAATIEQLEVRNAVLEEVVAPVGYANLTDPIQLKTAEIGDGSYSGFISNLPIVDYEPSAGSSVPPASPATPVPPVVPLPGGTPTSPAPSFKGLKEREAYRINNVKITIPQTGGIGSLIFVGLGAVFTGIAIYYLRNRKENEDT